MHAFDAQDVFPGILPANRLRRCISIEEVVLSDDLHQLVPPWAKGI